MNPEDYKRDETPTTLYNPLKTDFTCQLRDDSNQHVAYTIPKMDMATFPKYIADTIERKLVTAIYNERGGKTNPDKDMAEIRQEVQVIL